MRSTKQRARKWLIRIIALVVMVVSSQANVMNVSAGSEEIVVDNSSFANELDGSKWNAMGGTVVVKEGKIVFEESSTDKARLITRKPVTNTGVRQELFQAAFELQLKNVPEGQKFILAFSLANAEGRHKDAENLELVFENQQGIKVSLVSYDKNKTENVLVGAQACGVSLGKTFRIQANATSDNKININVNNKTIYSGDAPVDLAGRIGFLQTGSCSAQINQVNIVSYNYYCPENVNISEDFESGGMNVNALTSLTRGGIGQYPFGIFVEEYEGGKVLMLRNLKHAMFGTKYQYSNFELSFDIPYMLRENIVDEEGNVKVLKHENVVLGIGDATDQFIAYGYTGSADGITIAPNRIGSYKNKIGVDLNDRGFYDPTKNEGYSVKISVIDTWVTVYVKALDAEQYEEVLRYSLGSATPTGYIHFWTTGACCNMAIDNFKLVNKDQNGNVLDVETKISPAYEAEDWEYEPMKRVYREQTDEENTSYWILLPVFGATVAVAIVLGCAIVSTAKKRRKKGVGDVHES